MENEATIDWAALLRAMAANTDESVENTQKSGMDMERVLRMMALMKQWKEASAATPDGFAATEKEAVYMYDDAYYDACIQTADLRAFKAAIPHVEPRCRLGLSIAVKYAEIRRLQEHYNRPEAMQAPKRASWRQDVLRAMQPHLPVAQRQRLQLAEAVLQCMLIIEEMRREIII